MAGRAQRLLKQDSTAYRPRLRADHLLDAPPRVGEPCPGGVPAGGYLAALMDDRGLPDHEAALRRSIEELGLLIQKRPEMDFYFYREADMLNSFYGLRPFPAPLPPLPRPSAARLPGHGLGCTRRSAS